MQKGKWVLKCIAGGILCMVVLGLVTMLLWNWLVPALFKGPEIGFLQALGLLLLAKILFGGWGRGGWRRGEHSWRHRFEQKLLAMSPEQREKFKSRMREKWHCGTRDKENDKAGSID